MQTKELYIELAEKITSAMPNIRWVDLWHNQVSFLQDESNFPAPAIFLSFRILNTKDMGKKVQEVRLQVDTYLFFETFASTHKGSFNQADALNFIESLDTLHSIFHASNGQNYSAMRRIGFSPVDTGGAGNLYQQSFECVVIDYAAMKNYVDGEIEEMEVRNEMPVRPPKDSGLFIIRD